MNLLKLMEFCIPRLLIELGLILFLITSIVLGLSKIMLMRIGRLEGAKIRMDSQSLYLFKKRKLYNRFAMLLSTVALTIALFFLGWILLTLILKGIGGINLTMFMESTPPPGSKGV